MYSPDYKSFIFSEEHDGMKEAKPDDKSSSDDLFDLEVKHNNGNVARNPMASTRDKLDVKSNNGSEESKRRKSHCSKIGSVDCELPELVVFLQESSYHFIKDMRIDKRAQSHHHHGKCLVENCELDHRIISCILDSDDEIKRGTIAQNATTTMPSISRLSKARDDFSFDKSTKEIVPESLLLVSEAQKAVLTSSMTPLAAEKNDDNSHRNGAILVPKDSEKRKTCCNTDLSMTEAEPSSPIHQSFSEESSLFTSGHFSGLVSNQGPEAPSFRSVSRCSNSSTTSSRSFAFPVLGGEWVGSPEKMAKPENRLSKKSNGKCWRFFCCNF